MFVAEKASVLCSCGSRNCWEALASEKAALARYSQICPRKNSRRKCCNFNDLIAAASKGEPNALQVLQEMGKFLGIGVSNLIVGLSPQAVIVSGSITAAWDIISDELHTFAERSVRNGLPKTFLTTSTLGSQPTLIGAINLVLAKKFASV